MGIANLKYESEFIPLQNFVPFLSPQKTEPNNFEWGSLVSQIANQLSQVTLAVGQLQQGIAFTRAAPQGGADMAGVAESVRQLGLRLDDLEGRVAKT